jgi:hypothetical protein
MNAIPLDYYLFLLKLGIPYEGFVVDANGTIFRSICEPVSVPPESHYIACPPGINYDQSTFVLLTKSTLYYFPQDNQLDKTDILSKIINRVVHTNTNGTTTVDFGRGDLMVLPTNNSEIKIEVNDDYSSAPTVSIQAKDNSNGNMKKKEMPLNVFETIYGNGYSGWLDTKNSGNFNLSQSEIRTSNEYSAEITPSRGFSIAEFTASGFELGAGNSTFRLARMSSTKLSPKLYRRSVTNSKRPYYGGGRGNIKVYNAAKALKWTGRIFFVFGIGLDIYASVEKKQSWAKTGMNIGIGLGCIFIGGAMGLIIGIAYFGLDLLGVFDEREVELGVKTIAPDYYSPADNTRVFIPHILNIDGLDTSSIDSTNLQRLLLDN